jgi:hypothetical protein
MLLQNLKAWLSKYLTNEWMNEVSFLAPMAHIGWAALIVLATAILSGSNVKACGYASAGLTLFAALKEYVYDANFEIPKQTFRDNTEDFAGYLGGIALAWLIVVLHLHLHLGR